MDDYGQLLSRVDAWYRSVQEQHPDQVPCTKGCRDCCIGLFDVSLADRDLLRDGDKRYQREPFESAYQKWASGGLSVP